MRNDISVKSNTKRFAVFTNCNLSQGLFELTLFSMMLKNISFPLTVPRPTSVWGKDFSLQSPAFYSCIQFEIRKKIGLLILLNCEPASLTVFTTMRPKVWFPFTANSTTTTQKSKRSIMWLSSHLPTNPFVLTQNWSLS